MILSKIIPGLKVWESAYNQAMGDALIVCWRLLLPLMLVFLPASSIEAQYWINGQIPPTGDVWFNIQQASISVLWLLMLRWAQLDEWLYLKTCRAFRS